MEIFYTGRDEVEELLGDLTKSVDTLQSQPKTSDPVNWA